MAIGLYYACIIFTLLFVNISSQDCSEDQLNGYRWNATKSGGTSEQPCRTPNQPGFVFRTCKDGTWEQPIFSNCPTPMRSEKSVIELITYIGCGLSIFCCLLTIVFYIFFYKYISGSLTVLVTSLCLAVITSNIFLIIGLHRVESKNQCRIISVCLQYFPTVAVFTLSTIIIHISTTSFQKTNKCCIVASLFVSWALPGAVVAGYAAYTKLEEYGNPVNCWVQINTRLWWVYIGTILAMVLIMLLTVFGSVYRSYIDRVKRYYRIGVIPLFVVCMFTILTWVIGPLSVNEYHDNLYVLQIVFAVFNVLQGFTILMIFGLQSTKVKKKHRSTTSLSTRISESKNGVSRTAASEANPTLPKHTISSIHQFRSSRIDEWTRGQFQRYDTDIDAELDFYSTDERQQGLYIQQRQLQEEWRAMNATEQDETVRQQVSDQVATHKDALDTPKLQTLLITEQDSLSIPSFVFGTSEHDAKSNQANEDATALSRSSPHDLVKRDDNVNGIMTDSSEVEPVVIRQRTPSQTPPPAPVAGESGGDDEPTPGSAEEPLEIVPVTIQHSTPTETPPPDAGSLDDITRAPSIHVVVSEPTTNYDQASVIEHDIENAPLDMNIIDGSTDGRELDQPLDQPPEHRSETHMYVNINLEDIDSSEKTATHDADISHIQELSNDEFGEESTSVNIEGAKQSQVESADDLTETKTGVTTSKSLVKQTEARNDSPVSDANAGNNPFISSNFLAAQRNRLRPVPSPSRLPKISQHIPPSPNNKNDYYVTPTYENVPKSVLRHSSKGRGKYTSVSDLPPPPPLPNGINGVSTPPPSPCGPGLKDLPPPPPPPLPSDHATPPPMRNVNWGDTTVHN